MRMLPNIALSVLLTVASVMVVAAQQTVGLFKNEDAAFQGYTLYTPRHFNETYLLNMDGQVVHHWKHESRNENAKLLDSGLLLTTLNIGHPSFRRTPGPHGEAQLVDWNGNVLWRFRYADEKHVLHHDVVPMPNGNFLMSVFDVRSREEMLAAGRDPAKLGSDRVFTERLIEVKPNGAESGDIVWEWSVWDHLVQDYDSKMANFGDVRQESGSMDINHVRRASNPDWNHVSGLDYNAELDQIMLTFHGSNEIIIVDHSTTTEEARGSSGGRYGKGGELLYRYGNPAAYKAGTKADQVFNIIHNAHWIPKGSPNASRVMVLNNRWGPENSSVEIYDIPRNEENSYEMPAPDKGTGILTPVRTFRDFYTRNMGGMQELPNGNLLVDEAVVGRFLEVDDGGEVVWEFVNPVVNDGPLAQGDVVPPNFSGDLLNEVFRVTRVSADHPALQGKALASAGVLELAVGARADNPAKTPPMPPGLSPMMLERPANAGSGPRGGRADIDVSKLNLLPEQEEKFQAIVRKYNVKRRETVQKNRGDRPAIGRAMRKITQSQQKELKSLLSNAQFETYKALSAPRGPRGQ